MFAFEQRGQAKKDLNFSMNYSGNYSGGAIQRKTTIQYWPGYYKYMDGENQKSVLVGRKMEAELDPDDPKQGSTAGSSRDHAELMAHLKLVYPTPKVRGHLLNDHLGGMGIDVNFFPISSMANKVHLNMVEKHVKHLVYNNRGKEDACTCYKVEVKNEDGSQDFSEGCPRTSFECTVIHDGSIYRQKVCSDISNNTAEVTGDSMDAIGSSNNTSKDWKATKTLSGFERGKKSGGRYLLLRKNAKEETEVGTVYLPGREMVQSITEAVLAEEGTEEAIRETLMETGMDLDEQEAIPLLLSRIPVLENIPRYVVRSICQSLYSIEGWHIKREILERLYSTISYEKMKDKVEELFLKGNNYEFVKQYVCICLQECYTGTKDASTLMKIEVLGSELTGQIERELEKETRDNLLSLYESQAVNEDWKNLLGIDTTERVTNINIEKFFLGIIVPYIYQHKGVNAAQQRVMFLDNAFLQFLDCINIKIKIKIVDEFMPYVKKLLASYSHKDVWNFIRGIETMRRFELDTKTILAEELSFDLRDVRVFDIRKEAFNIALSSLQEGILHDYAGTFINEHFPDDKTVSELYFDNTSLSSLPDFWLVPSLMECIITVILIEKEGIKDGMLRAALRREIYNKMLNEALVETDKNEEDDDEDYSPEVSEDEDFLN